MRQGVSGLGYFDLGLSFFFRVWSLRVLEWIIKCKLGV